MNETKVFGVREKDLYKSQNKRYILTLLKSFAYFKPSVNRKDTMKRIFKVFTFIGAIAFVAGAIFLAILFFTAREQRDQMNSAIHVCIELKEDIPNLKTAELHMCDKVNAFTLQALKDTVSENIGVPYKEFPCKTRFRYIFQDNSSKEIPIEDFDCAGCSGTHVYTLSMDSVTYTYMP